jgi:type IV secretion system protein VirB9
VSSIELQAGEKILGEPQIGDSVRWVVTPISSGSGDATTPILVVKPKVTGLDTTMIVATDRRTYYLRLVSRPGEYISRVAFLYPDDQPLQWKLFLEQQAKEHKDHVDSSRISQTGNAAVDKLYFDYTFKVKSGADSIRPVRVLDDGEKTYIEMPSVTAFQELPTLVVEGPEGNEMVNFRVKGTTFIVDRLFVKAALLLGVGKHQELVEIERKDALTPHTEVK